VAAAGHHLQRLLGADDARQALRAAGAGQQAEVHFGQAALGRRHGHAVVAAQRHLEAAAERGAVDRGDDGLVRSRSSCTSASRAPRRLAELGDVGAGDEGAAVADQHDRLDRTACDRALTGGEFRVRTATSPSIVRLATG
jgi:hypothetical protein